VIFPAIGETQEETETKKTDREDAQKDAAVKLEMVPKGRKMRRTGEKGKIVHQPEPG